MSQEFTYDNEGLLSQYKKYDGKLVNIEYDYAENKTTNTYADGTTEIITKDIAGNIIKAESGNKVSEFEYDAGGMCIVQKERDIDLEIKYTYDNVKYTYNELNQITKIEYPNGNYEEKRYTKTGNLERTVVKNKKDKLLFAESYAYDNEDRVKFKINDKGKITQYEYDEQFRLKKVYYPAYDSLAGANQLEALEALYESAEGGIVVFAKIEYDDATKKEALDLLRDIVPDIAWETNGKISVWIEEYHYDANGNRIAKDNAFGTIHYNYDAENRLLEKGNTVYTYDANGNLIREKTNAYVEKEFEYTPFDRIKKVRLYNAVGLEQKLQNEEYEYDALHRRISQKKTAFKAITRSVYLQSGMTNLSDWHLKRKGERVNYRTHNTQYLYANGLYGIQENKSISSISYQHLDRLGSVRAISDKWGGIKQRLDYDAFGKPLANTNLKAGYLGKPYNAKTELYNYGYRDYQPWVARFNTADPIRDGFNWYAYCENNPVNLVDLWGLNTSDRKIFGYSICDIFDIYQNGFNIFANGFTNGFVNDAVDLFNNVVNIIKNPKKSAQDIYGFGEQVFNDPLGVYNSIKNGIVDNATNIYENFSSADLRGKVELVGNICGHGSFYVATTYCSVSAVKGLKHVSKIKMPKLKLPKTKKLKHKRWKGFKSKKSKVKKIKSHRNRPQEMGSPNSILVERNPNNSVRRISQYDNNGNIIKEIRAPKTGKVHGINGVTVKVPNMNTNPITGITHQNGWKVIEPTLDDLKLLRRFENGY